MADSRDPFLWSRSLHCEGDVYNEGVVSEGQKVEVGVGVGVKDKSRDTLRSLRLRGAGKEGRTVEIQTSWTESDPVSDGK